MVCRFKGNTWESVRDGRVVQSSTFKLVDLDARPKQIDLFIDSAEAEGDRGKILCGIFILDRDSLMWANTGGPQDESQRPRSFFTQPRDGYYAAMYQCRFEVANSWTGAVT
jgi:uncharacterized protein (TIGR03067 family)